MEAPEVRWIQRLAHFCRALGQLRDAVELARRRPLSRLEEQGLIQAFEFTHELAWKTLKDFLEGRGAGKLYGSKDATQAAFRAGLVGRGEVWMGMVVSRNLTLHTYDESTAAQIAARIIGDYHPEFEALATTMEGLSTVCERGRDSG